MLKRKFDTAAPVAILHEAAKIQRDISRREAYNRGRQNVFIDELYAQKRVLRRLAVETLGYVTHIQFDAVIEHLATRMKEAEDAADAVEQDQLEYEYQQAHNI